MSYGLFQASPAREASRAGASPGWVQRLEKRHQRGCLGGTQVFSIRRHIAATLDHLAYQLILGKLNGDSIQFRPALPSRAASKAWQL